VGVYLIKFISLRIIPKNKGDQAYEQNPSKVKTREQFKSENVEKYHDDL
jgi:hypothetical protein